MAMSCQTECRRHSGPTVRDHDSRAAAQSRFQADEAAHHTGINLDSRSSQLIYARNLFTRLRLRADNFEEEYSLVDRQGSGWRRF